MLVNLDVAQEYPSLQSIGTPVLIRRLAAASMLVEKLIGRPVLSATQTQVDDGDGEFPIFLRVTPVSSITKVTVTDCDGVATEYAGSEFDVNERTGELRPKVYSTELTYFLRGRRNMTTEYVGGYDVTPLDLQEAVMAIAAELHGISTGDSDVSKEKLGQYEVTYGAGSRGMGGIPRSAAMILRQYMRRI